MKNIISFEICSQCAQCCKNYPYVELSQYDIDLLEQVTGLSFEMFTNPKGNVIEDYFLKFRENGYCFFLNEKKGRYSCGVYKSRPEICRNFPSKPVQAENCLVVCKQL
ncbi:YkgJ family cysteine cluster protein [Desulfosarcina sp.]|uniref:YkgJ family cysteine cluster protein n=1 Tax=Desulfosarcina sp. TaxID=2027861 RepID=UPI0039B9B760